VSFQAAYWASAIPANSQVGNAALRTLTLLALHASERDALAYPSIKTLARERGAGVSSVKRHLRELEAAGLLIRVPDSHLVAHLQPRHRPTVWRLPIDADEGPQGGPSHSGNEGPQGEQDEGPQGGRREGPTTEKSNKGLKTDESHEKGDRAMISEAQADLGWSYAPVPKRFPKQCRKHQDDINEERCGGCALAREAHEEGERVAEADRKLQLQQEREQRRAAINGCDICDSSGWVDDSRGDAVRCSHPKVTVTA